MHHSQRLIFPQTRPASFCGARPRKKGSRAILASVTCRTDPAWESSDSQKLCGAARLWATRQGKQAHYLFTNLAS